MNITKYLERNNPSVLRAYERFSTQNFSDFTIGKMVLTLRPGFCGGAGAIREVAEIHSDYVILIDPSKKNNRSILSKKDNWWNDVYILSEDEVELVRHANGKKYREWCIEKIGQDI